MRRHSIRVIVAVLGVLSGLWLASAAGAQRASVTPSSLGYDVSFPQCAASLPSPGGFGIVGVNDGHPLSVNPCLGPEITWAVTSLSAVSQFYVNTANPGASALAQWPQSQTTPQACAGANTLGCSYDYGWNAGQASFQAVVEAETQRGTSSPTVTASSASWWLDVETGNTWQSLRTGSAPTSAQFANDAAMIAGERAALVNLGVTSLGIYATSQQWRAIVGNQGAALAGVKVWMPGYATLAAAVSACAGPSFTGGRVAMIQYPSNGLDGDYLCGLVSTPSAGVSSVPGTQGFSQQLSVSGESLPVSFTQASGAPSLLVSASGLVSTPSQLAPGTYVATGTMSSPDGLSGTFSYALVVGQLTQSSPSTVALTLPASASFTEQLTASGAGGPLSFTQTSGAPSLLVSPSGLVSTSGALARRTYTLTGAMSDAAGDAGTYSLSLTVGQLSQAGPVRSTSSPAASATFTDQIIATGAAGPLSFTQSVGGPSLLVSPSGLISTSGALAPGSYVVRGLMSDAAGDQGRFFYNLLVSATSLSQSSPSSISVLSAATTGFTTQLTFAGAAGPLSFSQSSGTPSLLVSPSGLISTSGALAPGTYSVAGSVADTVGDTGTFALSVTVSAPTPVADPGPKALRVLGYAVTGRTVSLSVLGVGFFGRPTIVAPVGTRAVVVRDTGRLLGLRVSVAARTRRGVHVFVIVLPDGKICSVRYVQR